jgi:tetratricopeptide (TPR) repeat protein
MKRYAASILLCFALASRATPLRAEVATNKPTADQLIDRAIDELVALKIDEAERTLASIDALAGTRSDALFARAQLAFYRGEYDEAVQLATKANAGATQRERKAWDEVSKLMLASRDVTAEYARKTSPDKRYVVLYPKGKDEVIAEDALEVLGAADRALGAVFGAQIPGPIRLEIYPSPETLAEVSPLTVEQIHTTGTVALSKWNRLMITSPKALVRGYPWADTITHELVHLWVSRLTAERAPVWLQEGTAKLLERSWRTEDNGLALDAGSRTLLHDAKRDGKLLTFDQMHPSIAMLPSEDDAILAFAEVATFMEAYVRRYGKGALRTGLEAIANGDDARAALAKAAGNEFRVIENEWRAGITVDAPAEARTLKTRFKGGDDKADESDDVVESTARKHMRIGDLLWDRGRPGAASKEYEKAHRADTLDPIVAARWGRAALAAGNPKGAVEALTPQKTLYPTHAPTHAVLGAAHLALGQKTEAARALREAVWLNPFDPDPQCGLAEASSDAREVARARRACSLLKQ